MGKVGLSLKRACSGSVLCIAAAIASHAQTFTTLHSFDGTDGSSPTAALVQGTDGNFYGTTEFGGANATCSPDNGDTTCGTIFQITPAGTLTTLHSFNGTDGASPTAALLQGSNGTFYGTTSNGGAGANCGYPSGCGAIFTIVPDGTPVTLYSFCSQAGCTDGGFPEAALVQGTDGNFYGTTYSGGDNGGGTVFKITPAGTLTTLYSFTSNKGDGYPPGPGFSPTAGLVQGSDGNFYGTTAYGGNPNCGVDQAGYCGTIFKITPEGTNLLS
jgi:uncharacterized repeat protein (TIGR03803 family)